MSIYVYIYIYICKYRYVYIYTYIHVWEFHLGADKLVSRVRVARLAVPAVEVYSSYPFTCLKNKASIYNVRYSTIFFFLFQI